jgi:mono/diheme cytochrome c family protein
MRKVIKILGIILGVILIVLVGFMAFLKFKPLPNYSDIPIREINIQTDSATLALGKKLVDHNCAGCHRPEGRVFTGGYFEDEAAHKAFGTLYVPNITQSLDNGIGDYSSGELYRLLRTGVNNEGKPLLPVMPRYVIMADEDINAMIAYLQKSDDPAIQADETAHPPHKPSLLAKGLLSFVIKPSPYKDQYPEKPSLDNEVAYGKYLVDAQMGCYFCHSAGLDKWDLENPENTEGYLGGGTAFATKEDTIVSPSLLMDGNSEVSKWNEATFIGAVKYGQRPGKPAYKKPMHPYPLLDSLEVGAIYTYLNDYSGQ